MDADFDSKQQLKLENELEDVVLLSKDKKKEYWDFPIIFEKIQYSLMDVNSMESSIGKTISFFYVWSFRLTAPFFHIAAHNILKVGKLISVFRFFNVKQSSKINALMYRIKIHPLNFMPRFFRLDEKEVECTPSRKFNLHGYSCLVSNNIEHLFTFLLIMIVLKVIISPSQLPQEREGAICSQEAQ